MDFRFTAEEEAFRQEVRDFIKKEVPQEWVFASQKKKDTGDEYQIFTKKFVKQLVAKGWAYMHWPEAYGGKPGSHWKHCVYSEELAYHGLPPLFPNNAWCAPSIILHGTEEQKAKFVPLLGSQDIVLAIGYTEPGHGSDLAGIETRAVVDGDQFVINGQKIFTSMAHRANYVWLLTRTNPDVPKHRGLSVLIVDMKTPGITVRRLKDMSGSDCGLNEVFFDDVRVPIKDVLIGQMNRGWPLVTTELEVERAGFGGGVDFLARLKRDSEDLIQFCKETERDGQPLSKDPFVRDKLAQMAIELRVARLLAYHLIWLATRGVVGSGSISKLFGSEMAQRHSNWALQIMGLHGQLKEGSKWAPLQGRWERLYQYSVCETVGAGTSEIQRNIIAMRTLGLPRM